MAGSDHTIWKSLLQQLTYLLFYTWYFLHTHNKLVLCALHAGCVQQVLPSLAYFSHPISWPERELTADKVSLLRLDTKKCRGRQSRGRHVTVSVKFIISPYFRRQMEILVSRNTKAWPSAAVTVMAHTKCYFDFPDFPASKSSDVVQ